MFKCETDNFHWDGRELCFSMKLLCIMGAVEIKSKGDSTVKRLCHSRDWNKRTVNTQPEMG